MEMHTALITLGSLLLVGLLADTVGRRTRLPRVTLLILFGLFIGRAGFNLLPPDIQAWYEFLATAALSMVAFLLGGRLSKPALVAHGVEIIAISIAVVLATSLLVASGLWLAGMPFPLALILGSIATATAPAAVGDVVRQSRAKGPFTQILLGIVAVDDAWGLILFGLVLAVASAALGNGAEAIVLTSLQEVGGAVVIGALVGFPAAFLTGRINAGEPMQAEALGVVFLCAGLSHLAGASFLLAGMVCGVIVVNFAKHHSRPFCEIEHIEWPFLALFFILAGASIEINGTEFIVFYGFLYIALRILARLIGGYIGGALVGAPPTHKRWIGVALVPQAGVALGMALVASSHFPEYRESLLMLTIVTTVFFELVGPVATLVALRKMKETA